MMLTAVPRLLIRQSQTLIQFGNHTVLFPVYSTTVRMSVDLLRLPATPAPQQALQISQQAPFVLQEPSWTLPWPLSLVLSADSPEKWTVLENLFYACLRTSDDHSARVCLERFKARFGVTNERVMGMIGAYHEATAQNEVRLKNLIEQYVESTDERLTNMVKRVASPVSR